MVAFIDSCPSMPETRALPLGVFDDDALLLRLDSCIAKYACPLSCDPFDGVDVAFEAARVVEIEAWDL